MTSAPARAIAWVTRASAPGWSGRLTRSWIPIPSSRSWLTSVAGERYADVSARSQGSHMTRPRFRRTLGTQTRGECRAVEEEGRMLDDRKLDVLRAIVEDYVSTNEPVGSKMLVERHQLGVSPATIRNDMGGARGRGLHHPAAHQRGAGADRQGLPAVRRQAVDRQAADAGRASRDRGVPARRGRPRGRRAPLGAAARAADPPGRGGAVPVAVALVGAPPRDRAAGRDPADDRADHRHRPGRAAGGRAAERAQRGRGRRPADRVQRAHRRPAARRRRRRS